MRYQSPPLYDSLCKLKPAAYYTTCRSPNKYRVFFPAAAVSTSLFQESLLVFVSCRLFGWSRLVWECAVFTYSWGGRVRVNPVSFGDFLKLLRLGSFPWVFNGPPYGSPSDNEQKSKLGTPQESLKVGFCLPGTPVVNLNSLDQPGSAQSPHLADCHIKSACSFTFCFLCLPRGSLDSLISNNCFFLPTEWFSLVISLCLAHT